ncbi:putative nucleic acid-binding Zn-ribbon protein [Rathayibacter agropyri]
MNATPADQRQLLTLASLDTRGAQLRHALATLPHIAKIQAMQARDNSTRRALAEKVGRLEDVRTELGRIESDVTVVEKRLARDRDRLQTASSAKDIVALEGEITSLVKRRGDLEDIELTLMERIEGIEGEVAAAQAERDEVVAALAALAEERDAQAEKLRDKQDALARDRASLVTTLPEDLVELYEKQRARYGVGAALLRGKVSEGSGVTLTESDLSWIRATAPDEVVLCPDSGCILVRGEESTLA